MSKKKTSPRKVGPSGSKDEKPEKAKKVKRVNFPIKDGVKLTTDMPEGFNPVKHNPIKKVNFERGGHYLAHRAKINRWKIEVLTKQADDFEAKSVRMLKFGDEKTVKKVKKIEKLQKNLEELKTQLSDAGIDISEILSGSSVDTSD